MRKDFYIFRHGETDENLAKRWQGSSVDVPLNATGTRQAEVLSEKMNNLGIEIIYSSPLKRANQTANIVASKLNIDVKMMGEFTEGCLGECEGMCKDDVMIKYPDIWNKWYDDNIDMSIRWPQGESKQEMQDRMFRGINKLINIPQSVIGIASHSGSMRYFLLAFGYGPHKIPNTALFHLIYNDGTWDLEEL